MSAAERLHARLWPVRGRHHRAGPLPVPEWPMAVPPLIPFVDYDTNPLEQIR
jgi:hypothetical protein